MNDKYKYFVILQQTSCIFRWMVPENISWPNSMVCKYLPCGSDGTLSIPRNWLCRYSSRLSYAHTAAVMSMVGYVLGLGDRHGENILFDSTSGDCIHVDFNCLFNRVWVYRLQCIHMQCLCTLCRVKHLMFLRWCHFDWPITWSMHLWVQNKQYNVWKV